MTLDAALTAVDGQTLGYKWTGVVENWHDRAFASFGDGHGVWETGGGQLPFFARNFTNVRQWIQPIAPTQLMPTILELDQKHFREAPAGTGAQLRPVWRNYGVAVLVTKKELVHTEAAYLIDGSGNERALFLWPFTAESVVQALRSVG